jgi:hypothetical protein
MAEGFRLTRMTKERRAELRREYQRFRDTGGRYGRLLTDVEKDALDDLDAAEQRIAELVAKLQSVAGDVLQAAEAIAAPWQAEAARLREALEKVITRVASSPKGSIGAIGNTYLCQIGVEEVERWRKSLSPEVHEEPRS